MRKLNEFQYFNKSTIKYILILPLYCSFYSTANKADKKTKDRLKAIQQSIAQNNLPQLKSILKDGNIQNAAGRSPLYWAVSQRNIEIAEWLIKDKKININIQTRFGKTALHRACLLNDLKMVQLLLKYKAKVNITDNKKRTPLHYTVQKHYSKPKQRKKQLQIVQLLAKNKTSLNAQSVLLETPLHIAVYMGNNQMASFLLQYKPNLSKKNIYGQTVLHQAVLGAIHFPKRLKRYESIVQKLLSHTIDTTAFDKEGKTALHYTAEKGLTSIGKIILEHNSSSIDLQTKKGGWTALHLSAVNRHIEMSRLLIEKGADVNKQDHSESTPLYLAVGSGDKEIVALLLKSKAQVFFKNAKTGKSLFKPETTKKLKDLLKQFKKDS